MKEINWQSRAARLEDMVKDVTEILRIKEKHLRWVLSDVKALRAENQSLKDRLSDARWSTNGTIRATRRARKSNGPTRR